LKALTKLLLICVVGLAVLACEQRTDQTDSGGVLLEMDWASSGLPFRVSVNGVDSLFIPAITIRSIVANPNIPTSQLMDVELDTLEVTFTRGDAGTRVPPPYVVAVLGTVPVGGTLTLSNWDVMSFEQFRNPPLSDLKIENGGFDKETGLDVIRLNLVARVFGRTRTGKRVESPPRAQTIEFSQ